MSKQEKELKILRKAKYYIGQEVIFLKLVDSVAKYLVMKVDSIELTEEYGNYCISYNMGDYRVSENKIMPYRDEEKKHKRRKL